MLIFNSNLFSMEKVKRFNWESGKIEVNFFINRNEYDFINPPPNNYILNKEGIR